MKRIILIIVFVSIPTLCFGQTTTFDLASFTPPKGWEKTVQDEMLIYKSPQSESGSFCVISIYKSSGGSGDLSTDFTNAWNELIVKRLAVNDKPQSSEKNPSENGWDSQTGTVKFSRPGGDVVAVLTTMSSYHKSMSILVVTNSQSYQQELDGFYNSVSMKKVDEGQKLDQTRQTITSQGTLSDYIFTPPPGWTKEVLANEIVLRGPDKGSMISILPMRSSSGDLEKDMTTIFWQFFPGWQADTKGPLHHIYSKGIAAPGWTYLKEEWSLRKLVNGFPHTTNGFVMLSQVNNQIAVICGSFPDFGLLEEDTHTDWQLFFYSLDFKNFKGIAAPLLTKDIIGKWFIGGSTGKIGYTFNTNGHYTSEGGYSTSRDISGDRVLLTGTNWQGDGKFTLKGNDLTLTPIRSNKPNTIKVRVFYKKESQGGWVRTIGLLQKSSRDGSLWERTMAWQGN